MEPNEAPKMTKITSSAPPKAGAGPYVKKSNSGAIPKKLQQRLTSFSWGSQVMVLPDLI